MIELKQVRKAFAGKPVLRALDWKIREGERWQIVGASGIGKTTLLRLLLGLEQPDGGQISGAQRVRFCPVFQEDRLIEGWSVVQNVMLVCDDEVRAREILLRLLPGQALDQTVRTLSGGMRRRVALARALAAQGDVLVLDEPFTGLDEQSIDRACAALEKYAEERAVLLVSHGTEQRFSDWNTLRLTGSTDIQKQERL